MENAIDRYQRLANMTAAPTDDAMKLRLLACHQAIGEAADDLRNPLQRVDEIKKFVFYGKLPEHSARWIDDNAIENTTTTPAYTDNQIDIVHGVLGVLSEGEEMLNALVAFRHPANELPEDTTKRILANMIEETGDNSWYNAILARGIGVPLSKIFHGNNTKLLVRYRDKKFSQDEAKKRDIDAELKALDDSIKNTEISVSHQVDVNWNEIENKVANVAVMAANKMIDKWKEGDLRLKVAADEYQKKIDIAKKELEELKKPAFVQINVIVGLLGINAIFFFLIVILFFARLVL